MRPAFLARLSPSDGVAAFFLSGFKFDFVYPPFDSSTLFNPPLKCDLMAACSLFGGDSQRNLRPSAFSPAASLRMLTRNALNSNDYRFFGPCFFYGDVKGGFIWRAGWFSPRPLRQRGSFSVFLDWPSGDFLFPVRLICSFFMKKFTSSLEPAKPLTCSDYFFRGLLVQFSLLRMHKRGFSV